MILTPGATANSLLLLEVFLLAPYHENLFSAVNSRVNNPSSAELLRRQLWLTQHFQAFLFHIKDPLFSQYFLLSSTHALYQYWRLLRTRSKF